MRAAGFAAMIAAVVRHGRTESRSRDASRRRRGRDRRSRPRRRRQQRRASRLGPGRQAVPAGHAAPSTRTASARRSPGRRRATSATASSPTTRRTCSPRTASRSGASSGASSWTTRSGCARRPAASARRSPSAPHDPLEDFRNDFGAIDFSRTPAAPGHRRRGRPRASRSTPSRATSTRWAVYGGTDQRLEWLREGPVNGDLSRQRREAAARPGRTAAAPLQPRQRPRPRP